MIELIFTACLLTAPADCREFHLTYADETLTPMACLMGSQAQLADWTGSHPAWRIARYKCAAVRHAGIGI
jgi:hypothetical protein